MKFFPDPADGFDRIGSPGLRGVPPRIWGQDKREKSIGEQVIGGNCNEEVEKIR